MKVTPGQAEALMCPVSWGAHPKEVEWADEKLPGPDCCRAKKCMAWRTFDREGDTGYCGLAGLPYPLNLRVAK